MFFTIALLIVGLITLIVGGDFIVKGGSSIALRLHLSPLVVGLTIVAFGTSAPELLISIQAALEGSPDIAMGNVIGSNICNLALVLGLTSIINPVKVSSTSLKIDWPMTMGASVLLYVAIREELINTYEGALFVTILLIYLIFIIRKARKDSKLAKELQSELEIPDSPPQHMWKDIVFIIAGCVGLYYGSEWFVGSAKSLALELGVQERVVGLTVVALGTSLPELVTASVASYRGQTDLALGNLMGSNIFNILAILGITSIIHEIRVHDQILEVDIIWMLLITLFVLPLMVTKKQVGRIDGSLLLLTYLIYIYFVIV